MFRFFPSLADIRFHIRGERENLAANLGEAARESPGSELNLELTDFHGDSGGRGEPCVPRFSKPFDRTGRIRLPFRGALHEFTLPQAARQLAGGRCEK